MLDSLSINLLLVTALLAAVFVFGVAGLWVTRESRPVAAADPVTEPAMEPDERTRPASGDWWLSMRRRYLWPVGFAAAFLAFTVQNAYAQTPGTPTTETLTELFIKQSGSAALALLFAMGWIRSEKQFGEYKVQEAERRRLEAEISKDKDHQEAIAKLAEKDQTINHLTALHEKTIRALGDLNANVGGINQMMAEDRRSGGDRRAR